MTFHLLGISKYVGKQTSLVKLQLNRKITRKESQIHSIATEAKLKVITFKNTFLDFIHQQQLSIMWKIW